MLTNGCLVMTDELPVVHYGEQPTFEAWMRQVSRDYQVGFIVTGNQATDGPGVKIVGEVRHVMGCIVDQWGDPSGDPVLAYLFARMMIGCELSRVLWNNWDGGYPATTQIPVPDDITLFASRKQVRHA